MFNFVFSTGNNDCPQEAMTNIRDRQKKKTKNWPRLVFFLHGHYPKNGTGGEINVYFAIIYKVDFEQIVFKNCRTIYKIEIFLKYFPWCSIIIKVIGFTREVKCWK